MKIQEMFLTPNKYSRPQTKLENINGVVVHYVGNAGSTAIANRNYFESLKSGETGRYASSHYIIGLEGEIIQCIPENEIAYCSNERNKDTIGIECCHPTVNGKFNEKTLKSLKELLRDIVTRYDLEEDDIIRHYDITGKKCPLYFVTHPNEWLELKKEVFKEEIVLDNTPDEYAKESVEKAIDRGIIKGDTSGNLKLHGAVSRQDLFVFLDRMGLL